MGEPEVRRHLNETTWHEVEDSGSGPKREAAELGWFTLPCAPETVRADGTPYDLVRARLVVSRFRSETGRGAGHLIDGWKYELFATDLVEEAWPAPELVTTYYGRTGQENRFSQEDRELGCDRIISYHLPGQHLANLIGLFVWNVRICRGLAQLEPPVEIPAQPPRRAVALAPKVRLDVPPSDDEVDKESPTRDVVTVADDAPTPLQARQQLDETLRKLDWPELLEGRGNWVWNPAAAEILCPTGSATPLNAAKLFPSGSTGQLRFLASLSACRQCPARKGCTQSDSSSFRKELAITVPGTLATRVRRLLAAVRGQRPERRPRKRHPDEPLKAAQPLPDELVATWQKPSPREAAPRLAPWPAVLKPAVLRQADSSTCLDVDVYVTVRHGDPPARPHPAIAFTAAERQHRRRTWSDRRHYNALGANDEVCVRLEAPPDRMPAVMRRFAALGEKTKRFQIV